MTHFEYVKKYVNRPSTILIVEDEPPISMKSVESLIRQIAQVSKELFDESTLLCHSKEVKVLICSRKRGFAGAGREIFDRNPSK